MLTLITAPPGSGKTLFAVTKVYEHLNQGRNVYTNIDGLKIPGVLQTPHDWRDLPNGSVVFYDEAQEHPAFNQEDTILNDKGYPDKKMMAETRDIARGLQIHRHFGFDIYLITQDPCLLERKTLALVGMHYHLYRALGVQRATLYMWRKSQLNPDTKSAQESCETKTAFYFPKHLYRMYDSATQHTHTITIPWRLIKWAGITLAVILAGLYNMSNTSMFGINPFYKKPDVLATATADKPKNMAQQALSSGTSSTLASEGAPANIPIVDEVKRVASVFASDKYCRAYNSFGDILNIALSDCYDYAENPYKLQAGDQALKQQRLQAINYTASGNSYGAVAKQHDGIVSLNN